MASDDTQMFKKIVNDPIHGHIELHPACVAIIDTPEFQRLRFLKQLGLVYFVFPGAAHNRFEHSIGTCHLAGQFARCLQQNQPRLGVTDKDILCVELAGLCHDLGHGPLSHLFDQKFIPGTEAKKHWKHEEASKAMLDHLIDEHSLMAKGGKLSQYLDEADITFIKEQIDGSRFSSSGEWTCSGRGKEKGFLYEIVSNKRNNVDVDKFDYFARDCHHLGIKNNFDHLRYMRFARVIEVDSEPQICIRDKEIANLYNMFYTRYTLHKYAYQHRVKSIIETMVLDAMLLADQHLTFKGKTNVPLKLSDCIHDMTAYTSLTDDVLFTILYSTSQASDMTQARQIMERIFNRDLYVCVYDSKPLKYDLLKNDEAEIKRSVFSRAQQYEASVTEEDVAVHIAYLDFGMKGQNPVEKLNVYTKHDMEKATRLHQEEASRILGPTTFQEFVVRIMCCVRDTKKCTAIKKASLEVMES
ncbi:unnamed protein product [Lymnaea stagnalis]|uniref:HD domain-containing protein n=1 Tax=Lymnaea stagnalis TaxID=6523 RepID=A0AAV2IB47_LYMST